MFALELAFNDSLDKAHKFIIIIVFGFFHNGKPVNNAKNATASTCKKLKNAHAIFTKHESVNSQYAKEKGNEKQCSRILKFYGSCQKELIIIHGTECIP